MDDFHFLPYNEDTRKGIIRHVLIRTSYHYDQIMVVLVTNVDEFKGKNNFVKELIKREPKITTVVQNINTRDTNVILGEKERILYGKGFIIDSILGISFKISAKSFYQVNPIQVEKLYSLAIKYAGLSGKERVLDAYCGIGTIGLIASKNAKEVTGVEIVPEAIKDAKNNAKANNITNAEFFEGDAGEFIINQFNKGIRYDVVIMDPPRKGSDEKFLGTLVNAEVKKIVYVSCDPATLARDLKYLSNYYNVLEATPVDMFPNTFHVETVCLLTKK
jgi:23S rRNA (uracil1939-C5)-methyltransferase